jgi:hypothetical protein
VQKDDPYFVRKAFVSHYLNVPFHVVNDPVQYPHTLIEELFAVSVYLMRNFELSPYRSDDIEDAIAKRVYNGEL